MTISARFSYFFVAFLLLAMAAAVNADSDRLEFVTSVEGIDEYRLDNGLRVLLMPDASRPTTTINITYFVGSKHESYGESGMAHLLEHMLFYGTPDHQDIKAEISERGGVANGTTWYERTNYFQTLPAGEENLEWAIRMESDRMVNSLIDEHDLASEMTVVRNEFEIGENNPFRVLLQRVMSTAYGWHGYGRSTIGARADIENVPIERLQAFYRKYYQPDNAILILSGNFDPDRAKALIIDRFGRIERPTREDDMTLWPTYTREPVQDGERSVTVRRSGSVQSLAAAYHIPAATHPDFAAVTVLSHILGDMPSGRLYKALVETELASSVFAISFPLPEPGLLMLFAQTDRDQDIDEVRAALLDAVHNLDQQPPSEEEVRRAINALNNSIERTLNDSNQVGIQLSEWAAAGDWRLLFLHRDRLDEVSIDDVNRVANAYLKRDNRTIGTFIPDAAPERAEIPDAFDTAELLAGYTGRDDRALGEAFNPTPDNIDARLVEFELANGARVALLPKATRGERIHGQIQIRFGSLDNLAGLANIPAATASMLMRGADDYSRQAIRDTLNEQQSTLNIGSSGANLMTVNLTTRRDSIQTLLDLTANVLKNPTFPESELAELRRQWLTSLNQQRDEPVPVASRALSRHFDRFASDHPDYTPDWDDAEARIRAVERDELVAFHQGHWGLTPASTISFVGDFDAEVLREQLETLFGHWTSPAQYERIENSFQPVEPVSQVLQLDDKASAVFIARANFPMSEDHPDYPAMVLAGHLLGGGFLSSRLSNRIRDAEGLSYSVGGGFSAHPIDEFGSFSGFAMYAPENRERLIKVMFEELQGIVDQGFDHDELEAGRRGYLQQLEVLRSDDRRLNGILNGNLFLDRDIYHQADYVTRVQALTVDDVNAAVRRHFDPAQVSWVVAGDFEAED